ncbi:hypothetical protein HDU91_001593 [Kappamyces sp. JEL0680]|nr:hypothetical protein HDU91_001593 [Kappamyces sp. JEL0680]
MNLVEFSDLPSVIAVYAILSIAVSLYGYYRSLHIRSIDPYFSTVFKTVAILALTAAISKALFVLFSFGFHLVYWAICFSLFNVYLLETSVIYATLTTILLIKSCQDQTINSAIRNNSHVRLLLLSSIIPVFRLLERIILAVYWLESIYKNISYSPTFLAPVMTSTRSVSVVFYAGLVGLYLRQAIGFGLTTYRNARAIQVDGNARHTKLLSLQMMASQISGYVAIVLLPSMIRKSILATITIIDIYNPDLGSAYPFIVSLSWLLLVPFDYAIAWFLCSSFERARKDKATTDSKLNRVAPANVAKTILMVRTKASETDSCGKTTPMDPPTLPSYLQPHGDALSFTADALLLPQMTTSVTDPMMLSPVPKPTLSPTARRIPMEAIPLGTPAVAGPLAHHKLNTPASPRLSQLESGEFIVRAYAEFDGIDTALEKMEEQPALWHDDMMKDLM